MCEQINISARQFTFLHAYACEQRKCLILKSVKSNSLIHKIVFNGVKQINVLFICLFIVSLLYINNGH